MSTTVSNSSASSNPDYSAKTFDTGDGLAQGVVLVNAAGVVNDPATQTTLAALNTKVTACNTGAIAGTVTANIGTSGSLALDATLTGGTQKTKLVDSGGTNVATISAAGAVKVDGSAVTQPVSGTITANIGTSGSLALDATLTGGTQQSKITDGTNVASVKAASTAAIATDKALVVAVSPNNTVGVTGTFWQATQPVSGSVTANIGTSGSLALDATLTGGTQQSKITDGTNVATVKAASTAAGATDKALVVAVSPNNSVAITAASLPLPSGAATSAKQPALGTAGTASADVITVQGIASMTALKVDGSGVTQPVSGTTTANQGTAQTAGNGWPIRVSDGSNLINVGDNANGAIKVNVVAGGGTGGTASSFGAAFPASGTAIGAKDSAGTNMAAMNLDASGNLKVNIAAGSSSGTQYTEDVASVADPIGNMLIARRRDSLGSETTTDGDNIALNATNGGQLYVYDADVWSTLQNIYSNTSGLASASVVDGANTTVGLAIMGFDNAGAWHRLRSDITGQLLTIPGVTLTTLAAWTSGTSLNSTQNIFTAGSNPAVLVQVNQTTTLTVGAITFEITYDGTNWVTISADSVIDPTSTTQATISLPYTLQASTNKPFLLLTKGAQGLRIKLSTAITGTATVTPNYALLAFSPVHQTILGAGSATIGSLAANQSVNCAQMNGVAVTMGNGVSGTGVQRVTLASDSTGQVAIASGTVTTVSTVTNLSQMNGAAITMGNGVSGTGVQRVTLASDSTGQVTLAAGAATIGSLAANQSVNCAQMNGVAVTMGNGVSGTGVQRVTLASDSTGQVAIASGTVTTVSTVTNLSQLGGTAIAMNTGVRSAGTQRVTIATDDVVPASQSGTWTVQPGNTANTTPWLVTPTPGTGGGWSKIKYAAQTTTVQTPKGTAGTFGGYVLYNPNATVAYMQVFDAATATTITLGTTVPDMIIPVPATSGANLEFGNGVNMANGLKIACTTTETGLTAPGTGLTVNILYK